MIVKTYWTFVSSSSGQCGQPSRAASNRQAFVGRSCAWKLETVGSRQSAEAPSWSEVCAPENIQDSGEMKFHLTLYYDFVPILLETFTFGMQNDDNIIGHLLYLFMCSLLLLLQDYISSRIGR